MTDAALADVAGAHEPSHIGPRLRARREKLGLSLRELARQVGVSASLISQIERDKVNPSVSTLYSLVRELGLGMGDLFSTESSPIIQAAAVESPLVTADDRPLINLESGVTWERLTPTADPNVEFLRVVYDCGSESCPEHSLIRYGGREYAYLMAGRLGVQIGFERYELSPGDSITFDASSPHRLWTIGDKPAEAIWVVAGRQGDARHPSPPRA